MLHQNFKQIKLEDYFLWLAENSAHSNFLKKESRSPRGFLPRPLLRAGEFITPPPFPQKNSGGVLRSVHRTSALQKLCASHRGA